MSGRDHREYLQFAFRCIGAVTEHERCAMTSHAISVPTEDCLMLAGNGLTVFIWPYKGTKTRTPKAL